MPRDHPPVSCGNSGLPQYQTQQDADTAALYEKKGWIKGGRKSRRKSNSKSKRKYGGKSCRRSYKKWQKQSSCGCDSTWLTHMQNSWNKRKTIIFFLLELYNQNT